MNINEYIKEQDSHWQEVMKLAEKYGFIWNAYGGVATLAVHEEQLKSLGKEDYIKRQKTMWNVELKEV